MQNLYYMLSHRQGLVRLFFRALSFFRVLHNGLGERGSTHSLFTVEMSDFEWFALINRNCYTSQLKYVSWLEENVSCAIGQNSMMP